MPESGGESGCWRSLAGLLESGPFQDRLQDEFPPGAAEGPEGLERREFLRLMGASLGLAGLAACTRQPAEQITPYVRQPEEITPGVPLFFATAMPVGPYCTGVLVQSREGRPIKIEGNPDHPASLGATDRFAQASVLSLYDPERPQTVTHLGEIRPWLAFVATAQGVREAQRARRGAGLRILTERVTSPTLIHQIQELLTELPLARWHQWDPALDDAAAAGTRLAFGEALNPLYQVGQADTILSLDADLLSCGPATLRHAREFATRRQPGPAMLRLYAVETTLTVTGAKADHRLPLRPSQVEPFAVAVARRLGVAAPGAPDEAHGPWIAALVEDLKRRPGTGLVIPGDGQPPRVHALAHAMNHALGSAGRTVTYTAPVLPGPASQLESLRQLVADMAAGKVATLLIIGANPVYTAPVDLRFAEHLERVGLRIHLSDYFDETSARCHWHVPRAHYLESWSDGRAFDGTATIIQPLIAPLYQARTAHEVVAAFSATPQRSSHDIVRSFWRGFWQEQVGGRDFDGSWRRALERGVLPDTAFPPRTVTLRWPAGAPPSPGPARSGLEIVFRPDAAVHDGSFATNAWLQEHPKPLSAITWDNVAVFSPATARRLGLSLRLGLRGGR